MIKKISQQSIYKDAWLEFFQDVIEFPNGTTGTYAWAKRKDGVSIVVVKDKSILLHKEYRYVVQGFSWEIQGGGIDDGESLEQAAVRELKEEAGIVVAEGSLEKIGAFYPLNSFNTEQVTIFMATVEHANLTTHGTEMSESITEQRFVPFDEVLTMIDSGEINDALTANAVQIVIRKLHLLASTLGK